MALSSSDLDEWVSYFQLLQENANEVGLEDEDDGIITSKAGGNEGI